MIVSLNQIKLFGCHQNKWHWVELPYLSISCQVLVEGGSESNFSYMVSIALLPIQDGIICCKAICKTCKNYSDSY